MIFSLQDNKGQTVSTDALIGIALFLIVVIFFISVGTDLFVEDESISVEKDATQLSSAVETSKGSSALIDGIKVDEVALDDLSNLSYNELKDALGTEADFCIFFEDGEGNIVPINNETSGLSGIGSADVVVAGNYCGNLSALQVQDCKYAAAVPNCNNDYLKNFGLTVEKCCSLAGVCCS